MKFLLSVLIVAVTYRLIRSQPDDVEPVFTDDTDVSTPDTCSSRGDVVFVADRSAGQSKVQFSRLQEILKRILEIILEAGIGECYRTALVSFSKKPKLEYGFNYASYDENFAAIDAMKKPKGQGFPGKALLKAIELFENDENPSPGENKVVILFTDGGGNDKTATIEAAKSLQSVIGAKVLIGKSIDPDATSVQQANRDGEINGVLANSVCGSELVYEASLVDDSLPQQAIQDMFEALKCGPFEVRKKPEDPPKLKPEPPAPGFKSDECFFCQPEYQGIFIEYPSQKWLRLYKQECGCELDGDGCIVPKENVDCECTREGCDLTADGEKTDGYIKVYITDDERKKMEEEMEKEEGNDEEEEEESEEDDF